MDLFLHIPKTAGITIEHIAERNYPQGSVFVVWEQPGHYVNELLESPRLSELRFVHGHFAYGLQNSIPGRHRMFTMLREPIALLVSFYHYIRRYEKHPSHAEILVDGVDFVGWLRGDRFHHSDNVMVRYLAGRLDCDQVDEADLATAQGNLADMEAFGVVEQFDASILMIADVFGWADPYYERANVFRREGDEATITDEARELVGARHGLDIELYDYALRLFEERVRAQGPAFVERLVRFREENARWLCAQ